MHRLKIVHRTYYNFAGTVQLAPHRLLLRPREGHQLHIETSTLQTSPPATLHWLRDAYDNSVAIATFTAETTQLAILSEIVVQHFDEQPLDFMVAEHAVQYPFNYEADAQAILLPYLQPQLPSESSAIRTWLETYWRPPQRIQTYALLLNLCVGINKSLTYKVREEPGVQTASETLQKGTGSCRDFANLFMEAARLLGLAARFVSGYLHALNSSQNFGATHAWAEVYLPGAGWKGFDPTIGEVVGSKHIAVAVARVPEVVSPVTGAFFGSPGARLDVGVWVTEL
jgi:transglutaminase-like putative cysteine protease